MPSNEVQLERVTNLLSQAQAVIATISLPKPKSSLADQFVKTLSANVDNERLSDAEFRAFVRNSLLGMS